MNSEITRVGVLRMGKVSAILYGFFGLVLLPLAVIAMISKPSEGIMMVLMIFLYPVMGFIGGIIFAALYNLAAKIGGGIQFEIAQVSMNYVPTNPNHLQLNTPQSKPPAKDTSSDDSKYAPPGYND